MTSGQWTALGTIGTFIGIVVSIAIWKFSNLPSIQAIDSNLAVGNTAPVTQNLTVNKLDLPKPTIALRPFEINIPNPDPEIGYDSDYIIEIASDYTIASFQLKIKLPESVMTEYVSLFNDDARGERAWYDFEIKDGYAFFNVSNAGGLYHLVLGHKKPEHLTPNDIKW